LTSNDDLLKEAMKEIAEGNKEEGVKKLLKAAETFEKKNEYEAAAKAYEEVALTYRDLYRAEECFKTFDKTTLMMVRMPQSPEVFKEIVRVNMLAAEIAEAATEYKKAADFYFRAKDFAITDEEKKTLNIRTADALENVADSMEEKENYSETISLLRKVSRLYYTAGDDELGERINDRAVKIAQRWAKIARSKEDYISAGNALAEAAQIMQTKGESPEATRTMMEAGEFYEAAHLYEKAGNIYDAAQEAYKLQRLTSARNQALSKAAEAYLKMEGKPEAVAPLLVKGGNMFSELGRVMKAKWAFKRASEMFEELAMRALKEGDVESEKKYLRYQAMCLKNWGYDDQAKQIYTQVTEFYLNQSKDHSEGDDKELQAVALEEAAEVFLESGEKEESTKYIEQAISLYTQLADEKAATEDQEGASKIYSKAADCAARLGDKERAQSFHWKASESAEKAAEYYKQLGVPELSTIWIRTAGTEALLTNSSKMIEKAVELLEKSAEGFKAANELKESFEDLFGVFEARFMYYPEKRRSIKAVISSMDEIAKAVQDDVLNALVSLITALNDGNHIGALLTLQANEEDLLAKADRIRGLIAQSKKVRATK
jgi:tetratricopeptide (TPR) repeat protein